MSAGLNDETFDGTYQDKLVKRLRREARTERRDIIGLIREEFGAYRQRMGGEHMDFMHRVIGKNSLSTIVIMERFVEGSGQGKFSSIWFERLAIDDDGRQPPNKVIKLTERSFSSSPYHNGFRHEQRDGMIHIDPDLFGTQIMSTATLPSEYYHEPVAFDLLRGKRRLAAIRPTTDPFKSRLNYYGFVPQAHVGISDLEMFSAPPALYEVAGILMSLGPDSLATQEEVSGTFEDRLWQLRRIENAQEAN